MYRREIELQFQGIRKLRKGLGKPCKKVTFKDKFAAILEERYDDAVVSLRAEPRVDGKKGPTWVQYMLQRHEQRRQEAVLRLRSPGFCEDLLGMAKRWGLGTNLCEIEQHEFQDGGFGGFVAWYTVLEWASDKWAYEHLEERRDELRTLAQEFSQTLGFDALMRGIEELQSRIPMNRFATELSEFCSRYGLSPLWERSVEGLLVCGKLYVPEADCRLVVRPTETGTRVFIEIFPETRRQDLVEKWREPLAAVVREHLFPEQSKRRRVRPKLERDAKTLRELSEGRSIARIAWSTDEDEYMPDARERKLRKALRKGSDRHAEVLSRRAAPLAEQTVPEEYSRWALQLGQLELEERRRELYF